MSTLRCILSASALWVFAWGLVLPGCTDGQPPSGGNACSEQSDCKVGGTICFEGVCRQLCTSCSGCDPSEACESGVCLPAANPQCTSHEQCITPPTACQIAQGICCGGVCSYANPDNGTTCLRDNGSPCANTNDGGNDCASGYCVCADASCAERKCREIECKCQYKVDDGPSCDGNVNIDTEAYVNQCPATGAACDGAGSCQAACTDCCVADTDCEAVSPRKCECVNDYCSSKKCRLGDCATCRYNINDATTCNGYVLAGYNDAHSTCTAGGCDGAGNCQKANGEACTVDTQCQSNICACGFCSAVEGLSLTRYDVVGGGTYCPPATGLEIRLTGSDVGATYQLKCNGVDVGAPMSGTSGALSFGLRSACSAYTVLGTQAGKCATLMTGSAVVVAGLALSSSFTLSGGGPYCEGGPGTVVRLSGSEANVSYKLRCTSPSEIRATVPGTGSQISFGAQLACAGFSVDASRSGYCTATIAGGAITTTSIAQLGSCGAAGHCCGGACDESPTVLGATAHEDCMVNPGVLTCVGLSYGYELKTVNSECGAFPPACDIPEFDCSVPPYCSTPRACTGHNVVGKCTITGECNPTEGIANAAACHGIRCSPCEFCSITGSCDVVPPIGTGGTSLVCSDDGATCDCCKSGGACALLNCACSPACSGNVPVPCNRYPQEALP